MNAPCHECCRLWREFASATIEHIRLDNKLRIATFQGNAPEKLTKQTESAAAERARSKQAISQHQKRAHPGEGAAGQT
jgi:hypothetical protein